MSDTPHDLPDAATPRTDAAPDAAAETPPEGVRLQKALANAGVASRRAIEALITAGKVVVNGKVVTILGTRIHPEVDRVVVNGTPVQFDQTRRYLVLNKPTGVVSSMHDEHGHPDLREFTRDFDERVYNVGRLDAETSGLLILTNDGELAHTLAHPSFEVTKTYVAKVRGRFTPGDIKQLLDGFDLEDGPIRADAAHIVDHAGERATLVEVTLHSGRNRIVRRMFAHLGHPVQELVRRSFGPLHLGNLRTGEIRELHGDELAKLLRFAARAQRFAERGGSAGTAAQDARGGSGAKPAQDARSGSGRGTAAETTRGGRATPYTPRREHSREHGHSTSRRGDRPNDRRPR